MRQVFQDLTEVLKLDNLGKPYLDTLDGFVLICLGWGHSKLSNWSTVLERIEFQDEDFCTSCGGNLRFRDGWLKTA